MPQRTVSGRLDPLEIAADPREDVVPAADAAGVVGVSTTFLSVGSGLSVGAARTRRRPGQRPAIRLFFKASIRAASSVVLAWVFRK